MSWASTWVCLQGGQFSERRNGAGVVCEHTNQVSSKIWDQDVLLTWIKNDVVRKAATLPAWNGPYNVICGEKNLCWRFQEAIGREREGSDRGLIASSRQQKKLIALE